MAQSSGQEDSARCIVDESNRLCRAASHEGILLRVIGSVAVRLHCRAYGHLLERLHRRPVQDLDFMAYSGQQRDIVRFFEKHSYVSDPDVVLMQEWGVKRQIFTHTTTGLKVDVFLDELRMAHTLEFRGRLELDEPTTTVSDILLSKLQIHEITENDIKDAAVILAEHKLGTHNVETIDVSYIVHRMRRDWGFFHTTLINLDVIEESLGRYTVIPESTSQIIRERLHALRTAILSEPKTVGWRVRALLGTRIRWYEQVGDVTR